MRKAVIFLLTAFLVFSLSNCLSVSSKSIVSQGYKGDILKYNLTIENDGTQRITIRINSFTKYFSPSISQTYFELEKGQSKTITISIYIPDSVESGRYFIPIYITSYLNNVKYEEKTVNLPITVLEVSSSEVINITGFNFKKKIDPRESFTASINVTNNFRDIFFYLTFQVSSEKGIVYNSTRIEHLKLGENQFSQEISLNPLSLPGNYTILVRLQYINELLDEEVGKIEVIGYELPIVEKKEESSILGREIQITLRNLGTLPIENYTLEYCLPFIERYLISSLSQNAKLSNGKVILNVVNLTSGEEITLSIKISYLFLILLPFIVVGIIGLFFLFGKKMKVEKELLEYKMKEGVLEAKIAIKLKNITFRKIKNIKVIDKIPIFVSHLAFATVNGDVDKERRIVEWKFDELKPKEEIIISYKIKTKMEILGKLNFPPCKILFRIGRKVHKTKSNSLVLEPVSKTL